MSGIRGDFGELEKLIKKMDELSQPAFRRALSQNVSEEAIDLVKDEFETGVGPYGKAWPAPVMRLGNKGIVPLSASGRLRNSFHVAEVSPHRFTIETNVIYASTHQYGATIRAKNWRTVTYQVDTSKAMARRLARTNLSKAAIRAALKTQYANGGRYKTVTVRRFGLVFRGVTTTQTNYTSKSGKARRSTSRTYGGWITKLSVVIPQRQIIPENTLPPKWIKAFQEVAKDVLDAHMDSK